MVSDTVETNETINGIWSGDNSKNDDHPNSFLAPNSSPSLTQGMIYEARNFTPPPNCPIDEFRQDEWLTDINVDFYMDLIKARNDADPKLPKIYVFKSVFFQMLIQRGAGLNSVKETTGNDNIFNYDLIFIPLCIDKHWRLVVVDLRVRSVLLYDSLHPQTDQNKTCLRKVAFYLKNELNQVLHKALKKEAEDMALNAVGGEAAAAPTVPMDQNTADQKVRQQVKEFFDSSKWIVKSVELQDIPRQCNCFDCGIFMLQYADYLSRRMNFDFSQINMPYFRTKMAYELLNRKIISKTL